MPFVDKLNQPIGVGFRVVYSDRYASTSHTLRTGAVVELGPPTGLPVVILADHSGKLARRAADDVVVV